jgi:hypothetical protein
MIVTDEPTRVARLPHDAHGRPVPWFVHWIDGKPDFRIIAPGKVEAAISERICWMCGGKLTRHAAFVIGPMCVVNRTTAEPPCHIECAEYAATHCPFLTVPQMTRRETGQPDGIVEAPGVMLRRNPGVVVLWITKTWSRFNDGNGGQLIRIGDPSETRWFAQGRPATRDEAEESIAAGVPILTQMAMGDPRPKAAIQHLGGLLQMAARYLPPIENAS